MVRPVPGLDLSDRGDDDPGQARTGLRGRPVQREVVRRDAAGLGTVRGRRSSGVRGRLLRVQLLDQGLDVRELAGVRAEPAEAGLGLRQQRLDGVVALLDLVDRRGGAVRASGPGWSRS